MQQEACVGLAITSGRQDAFGHRGVQGLREAVGDVFVVDTMRGFGAVEFQGGIQRA